MFKIFNEIMNDAFWLGYILEIKRKITDYSQKEILSSFLIFYSSIFAEETIKSNYGGLSGKRDITLEDIENFRNWDLNKKENFELYDGLVATPSRWLEILMPDIYVKILEEMKALSKCFINKITESKINKKSYSSYKLFKKGNINNNEKLYILHRYGLIKTTMFIDNIIKDNISFNIGKLHFDFKNFIMKAKAIIIEMIWNDKKVSIYNSIIDKIFEKNKRDINDSFYSVNRKCRNNLHYSDYHFLSKKDITILDKYQDLYLNNVLETFDSYIFLKFGIFYNIGLSLAKLEYWSRTDGK